MDKKMLKSRNAVVQSNVMFVDLGRISRKLARAVTVLSAVWIGAPMAYAYPDLPNPSFEFVLEDDFQVLGEGYLPYAWWDSSSIQPGGDTYSVDGTFGLVPSAFGNFPNVSPKHGNRFIALWKASNGVERASTDVFTGGPDRMYRLGAWMRISPRPGHDYPAGLTVTAGGISLGTFVTAQSASAGWVYGKVDFPSDYVDFGGSLTFEPVALMGGTPYVAIDDLSIVDVTSEYGPKANPDFIRLESVKESEISISELIGNDVGNFNYGFEVFLSTAKDCQVTFVNNNSVRISPYPNQFVSSAYFYYVVHTQYGYASARVDVEFGLPAYWFSKTNFVEFADINSFGADAGTYLHSDGVSHRGRIGNSYLTDPQGGEIFVRALNNKFVGVGYARRQGVDVPFSYATTFTWLATVASGSAQALDINDSGTVAGWYTNSSGATQACIWSGGKILPVGPAAPWSKATAIGGDGLVFGEFSDGVRHRVFAWKNGETRILHVPDGASAEAHDLMTGTIRNAAGMPTSVAVTWDWTSGNWAPFGATTNPTAGFSGNAGCEIVGGVPTAYPIWFQNAAAWELTTRKDIGVPLRCVIRRDDSRKHLIMEAGTGTTNSLYAFRLRTPQDWERTRGIGEVAITNTAVVGGSQIRVGYAGDRYESIVVQSNAPDVVPTQTVQADGDGYLWIATNAVSTNRTVAVTFVPSYSEPPIGNPYIFQVLGTSQQAITGTWNSRLQGVDASAIQLQALFLSHSGLPTVVAPVTVSVSGYQIGVSLVPGTYDLVLLGPRLLSSRANGVSMSGGTRVMNVVLRSGDADGDDTVSVFDYIMLSDAFDTSIGDAGFNTMADFDGDGVISVFDYIILSDFFDETGQA